MTRYIFLDSGPVGLLTNPKQSPETEACLAWFSSLLGIADSKVVLPEIADYEVRRELIRAGKQTGLRRLDALKQSTLLQYAPLTTDIMLKAAEFWAQARQQGIPTADPKALDGDVILAAQAFSLLSPQNTVIIATTNVGHLGRFADARLWRDIPPA